ncbi:unnamed protein product [Phyllotreta striolata]|uniref:Uncharacterized protein n=1 Tax=Phyllotreta striolata TaxID=444603 RepID=A0A9N9XSU5_PHYSR|nr:unnamed protein product [Phyllotreta striolata]
MQLLLYESSEVHNSSCYKRTQQSIKKCTGVYKTTYVTVQNFNIIFGKLLFARLVLIYCEIMGIFMIIVQRLFGSAPKFELLFIALYVAIVDTFFVVRSIISCENVENAGAKLGVLCRILYTEVQDPRLKEQLNDLANLIAALPLSFSVSGFFKLNKQLIPSLISGITSYLIIMIQFKSQEACK